MPELPISFSVILPVYKGEAYLAETLRSVLNQTLPPREILVLDDGSPDGCAAIARSFGERVTVIRRRHFGVSATRNFGASIARSSWLAFLDQDDLWEPEYLASHAQTIRSHPRADLCYSGRRHLVQGPGTTHFELTPPVPVPSPADLRTTLLERAPFTPSAATIRRTTFFAIGGFNSRHNSVEDWDLWLRLLNAGAIFTHCPEPLLRYRIHAAANTNNPLPVLERALGVVYQNILPRMSPFQRATRGRRIVSRLQGEAAILLREIGRRDVALPWMLRSIATHPFHEPRRYKIASHMLLHRTIQPNI